MSTPELAPGSISLAKNGSLSWSRPGALAAGDAGLASAAAPLDGPLRARHLFVVLPQSDHFIHQHRPGAR